MVITTPINHRIQSTLPQDEIFLKLNQKFEQKKSSKQRLGNFFMFIDFYNSIFWALKAFVGKHLLIGIVTIGLLAAQFLVHALITPFLQCTIDGYQQ